MERRGVPLAALVCSALLLAGCLKSTSPPPKAVENVGVPAEKVAVPDKAAPAEPARPADMVAVMQSLRLGDGARMVHDDNMLAGTMLQIDTDDLLKNPMANEEVTRDELSGRVYAKAAPSIVVVKTKVGHGTGSLISEDGWVLTNYHVIAKAIPDGTARIYMGKLDDGIMHFDSNPLPAVIHMANKDKDLALLMIQAPGKKFQALKFAEKNAKPTDNCYAIGHPKSGLLWTIRKGEVAGAGFWPSDGVNMLSKRVANPAEHEEAARSGHQVQILTSNCGINYGDSGGPLLDTNGDLIAVTFAMPTEAGTMSLAYHIHLDEVKKFLNKKTPKVEVAQLDPWPAGAYHDLFDLDGDGTPDALGIANTKGGPLSGLMFDLLQQNNIKSVSELGDQPRKWRFNVALHFKPQPTAYYDSQLKGTIDLVMSGRDGGIQARRLDEKGQWASEDAGPRPLLDPFLLPDRTARDRLARIAKKLQEK